MRIYVTSFIRKTTFFTLLTCSGLFAAAQDFPGITKPEPKENKEINFPKADQFKDTKLTYKIINALNQTYGYQVHADGRLMINQNSIPALPGNNGFRTREQAEQVAQLVIKKIRNGEMPPTVTVEELRILKIK